MVRKWGVLLCACLALSGLRARAELASGFAYHAGSLMYYEIATGGTHYYPIRIEGGKVYFQSDGSWWDSGVSEAELRSRFPGSSGGSTTGLGDLAGEAAVARQRQELMARGLFILHEDADSFMVCDPLWTPTSGVCFGGLCGSVFASCCSLCPSATPGRTFIPKVRQSVAADLPPGWRYALSLRGSYVGSDYDAIGGVEGTDAKSRLYTSEASARFLNDRWLISVGVPYSRFEGQDALDGLDSETLGLKVTPRYRILRQNMDGLNLDALAPLGISRTMYDDDVPNTDDADFVEAGCGVYAGRTMAFGDLRATYLYLPTWNIDGDPQLSGGQHADQHLFGLSYGVPLGWGLLARLTALYTLTPGLPDGYDRSVALAKATLSYQRESWGASIGAGHSFASSSQEDVLADAEVHFNW